ncbi:ArsR family transcriptional regulator [Streptomyces sp. NPDC007088]|uniref:ArsR family transcriptional regulator n=1 Tax=Streptomyces sp. NPDC007088 TaxID=3364773 RepID=UPI003677260D
MGLEERVSELEARVAALEGPTGGDRGEGESVRTDKDFWALEALKGLFDAEGVTEGGVLFAGTVGLPGGLRYEWQYGRTTASLFGPDWSDAADALAALGHPVRLRLLREILAGRHTVAELTGTEGLGTTGQIYHHLRQLTAAGWLRAAGRAQYEVPGARVVPLLVMLTAAN